jgi:small-conductance mechanosensitive channel
MSDFFKLYGRLSITAIFLGSILALDNLFTGPLSFVSGISTETLKQFELAAFILVMTLLAARFFKRDIVHGILERRSGGEVPKLIGDISSAAILFTGICVIAAFVFKKDVTALVATGGAGLMLIGLALRDFLLAAFTGVIINIEKPFRPGDLIKINDKIIGGVKQITWRATILKTNNGILTVPNMMLANATIENLSQPNNSSKRKVEVLIDYDTSVESAERILYSAVIGALDVKFAKPPAVFARRMERDGVLYVVEFTITNFWEDDLSEHAVIKSILQCMRNAGVSVSFPKSEVIQSDHRVKIADRSLDRFYLVQQCRIFSNVSHDTCKDIASLLVQHHFQKGETIVRAGETCYSLFIVGEGMAKQNHANRDGSKLIENRFIATQSFGRKSLFASQPQAATVLAESNVMVYELRKSALAPLLQERPNLRVDFASALAQLDWLDLQDGAAEIKPDPVAIEHLKNISLGQIDACYERTFTVSGGSSKPDDEAA